MAKKKDKGNWGKWMLGEKKKKSKSSRKSGDPRWSKEFWGEESDPKKNEDEDVEELEEAGTGHDCKEVHPDESHAEWEEGQDEHDKNSASEGPHGESKDKPHKEEEEEELEEGKDKPEWLKKKLGEDDGDEDIKEEAAIPMFIKSLAEKNYAEANKYLQAAVENKLRGRIANTAKKLGF